MNAFVHIIESPASSDLLDGRCEGRVLSEALGLAGIPHCYNLAVDKNMFIEALTARLISAWSKFNFLPILHLSMHGSNEGVVLTSGDFFSWHELRGHLLPLLRVMNGGLLVCMSSCFGSAGYSMAMYSDQDPPFWAIVGNKESATWADAAIAYVSFYHLFFKEFPLNTCVESMKVASGDHRFECHYGQNTKNGWLAFVEKFGPALTPPPEFVSEI